MKIWIGQNLPRKPITIGTTIKGPIKANKPSLRKVNKPSRKKSIDTTIEGRKIIRPKWERETK